jgi:putative thioredoxin
VATSQWVVDVTAESFQHRVIDESRERPVVVDFWAPWCGPCRALSPVLESLAAEKDGAFLLAKVNTDDNPEVAQAFQVNGIPAVFAVKDGQVVSSFEGALPEAEVRRFLDEIGVGGASAAAEDALELEGRDPKAAAQAYRQMFSADPQDPNARVGLARVLLATGGTEAEVAELLAPVTEGSFAPEAERLRAVLGLRDTPHADSDLATAKQAVAANGEDAAARLRLGEVLAARGEFVPAMDELLVAAEADKALAAGPVRELMVKLFTAVGAQTPTAAEYRSKLRNVLY